MLAVKPYTLASTHRPIEAHRAPCLLFGALGVNTTYSAVTRHPMKLNLFINSARHLSSSRIFNPTVAILRVGDRPSQSDSELHDLFRNETSELASA